MKKSQYPQFGVVNPASLTPIDLFRRYSAQTIAIIDASERLANLADALNIVGLVSDVVKDKVQINPTSDRLISIAKLVMNDIEEKLKATATNEKESVEILDTLCKVLKEQNAPHIKRIGIKMERGLEQWKLETGYYLAD